ncbi:hypothetical protein [Desulfuromonas sp. TF]|uniref:hypothetical protein n=1 Tax=Desulfuromonas sp. TF TaxID=1232410 RepID=UPI00040EA4FD|nr:hypothetical protein [Desulfuromonas sp. TF]
MDVSFHLPTWLPWFALNLAGLAIVFFLLRGTLRRILAVRAGRLYLVGRVVGRAMAWDVQGVFTSKEAAIEACRKPNYFYFALPLDQELPEEPVEGGEFCFPLKPEISKGGN